MNFYSTHKSVKSAEAMIDLLRNSTDLEVSNYEIIDSTQKGFFDLYISY